MASGRTSGIQSGETEKVSKLTIANCELALVISNLQKEIEDLREKLSEQKEELEETSDKKILKEKLERASNLFYEQDEAIRSLQDQLANSTRRNEDLEKKNEELKEKLEQSVIADDSNKKLLEKTRKLLEEKSSKLKVANKRVVEKDLDIRELRAIIYKYTEQELEESKGVTSLEGRLKTAEEEISFHVDTVNRQKDQIHNLRSQLELLKKVREEKDCLEKRCKVESGLVGNLRKMLGDAREKMKDLQKDFEDLQKRFEDLKISSENEKLKLEANLKAKENEIKNMNEVNDKLMKVVEQVKTLTNFGEDWIWKLQSIADQLEGQDQEAHLDKKWGDLRNDQNPSETSLKTTASHTHSHPSNSSTQVSSAASSSPPLPKLPSPPSSAISGSLKRSHDLPILNEFEFNVGLYKKPRLSVSSVRDGAQRVEPDPANCPNRTKLVSAETDEDIDVEDI